MADTPLPDDDATPDPADPAEPSEADNGEIEDVEMAPESGMPPQPEPLGMMVAFLPSDVELDEISVDGGLPADDLHLTLRYYGTVTDPTFIEQVHDAARTIAGNVPPFVAQVTGRRQLGDDTPPADVLILGDHKAFRLALAKLPPSDRDYPSFTPHITVGYGIGDDALAKSTPDNDVVFDHIVVANGNDDWTVYMLGDLPPEALDDVNPDDTLDDIEDVPMLPPDDTDTDPVTAAMLVEALGISPDPTDPVTAALELAAEVADTAAVTAGIDDIIEGKINAPGSRTKSKTIGKLDPRPGGKHQKCYHGSPALCKSVKWIAMYTALRDKGYTKAKSAAIANSAHNRWKKGLPMKGKHMGKHPIIRKTI